MEYRPAEIVHCGAISGPMVAGNNLYSIIQNNLVGTANILEIARLHRIRRVVFCSSVTACGPTPAGPVPENIALHPTSVYGATKAAGGQLITAYSTPHQKDGVSVPPSRGYGPP